MVDIKCAVHVKKYTIKEGQAEVNNVGVERKR